MEDQRFGFDEISKEIESGFTFVTPKTIVHNFARFWNINRGGEGGNKRRD